MIAFFAAILLLPGQTSPQDPPAEKQDPGWPREYKGERGSVVIYQPQAEEWTAYTKITARAAVKIRRAGSDQEIFGALRIEAATRADMTNRSVYIYDLEFSDVRSLGLDTAAESEISSLVRELLPRGPVTISLDRVLAGLERSGTSAREIAVSLDPPPIFVSTEPAILVMIDGKPVPVDIKGAGLQFIVNTNWDLFLDKSGPAYYLRNDDMWLTATAVEGPWTATGELPSGFSKLPDDPNWSDAKKYIPARSYSPEAGPRVFVSNEPAELIVINGVAQPGIIDGTRLFYISNTESDVFFHKGDRYFYFLTSGRWFRSASKDGPWTPAGDKLPTDFAQIPEDHPKGHVLSSVRGTVQAEEAVLLASLPETATVRRDQAEAPPVDYIGDPQFQQIDGTQVAYAANTPGDVFKVGDLYYMCYQGVWFASTTANGPWEVTDSVPKAIYEIPPESSKHHVAYVEVYESTPTTVTCGYTSGYTGMFISLGLVFWGTGYYYPPYVGWGYYPYPIYYPYPFYTYGAAAYYNPHTGTYGRGAAVYGPYGGYGRAAAYNPRTGTYARGASAWGPYGGAVGGVAYNPRTGGWGAGYRAGNGYESWGESVVGRGDGWVHRGYYANDDEALAFRRDSQGNRAVVGRDDDDNLYAGRDGNVYKQDDDGNWYRGDDGDWNRIDPAEVEAARAEKREGLESRADERRATGEGAGTREERAAQARERAAGEGVSAEATGERAATVRERAAANENVQARAEQRRSEGGAGAASDRAVGRQGRASTSDYLLRPEARGQAQERRSPSGERAAGGGMLGSGGSVRDVNPDVLQGLERDAQARSRGNQRTQQSRSYQRSGGTRSRSYSSRAGGRTGGRTYRGGGGRRRRR